MNAVFFFRIYCLGFVILPHTAVTYHRVGFKSTPSDINIDVPVIIILLVLIIFFLQFLFRLNFQFVESHRFPVNIRLLVVLDRKLVGCVGL